jgi:hypothetical protein
MGGLSEKGMGASCHYVKAVSNGMTGFEEWHSSMIGVQ